MDRTLKQLLFNEPLFFYQPLIYTTRLRLARNLKKYPFPHQMNQKQADSFVREVVDVIYKSFDDEPLIIPMADTDRMFRTLMVERHVISPEFAEDGFGKTLVWFPDSGLRILLNEEDHLRISFSCPHDSLKKAWEILNGFDDKLAEKIEFAFDREFGYLTSCMTNLGSGLRISSLLFLPSLKFTRKIRTIFDLICKLGCIIRGFYGEGSTSIANFYQIATGNVLGREETQICESFDAVMYAVKQKEIESMRKIKISSVMEKIKIFLEKVFKKNLSGIPFEAGIEGISLLLFGKKLGIINLEEEWLKRLLYRMLPASLQVESGMHLKIKEQEKMRQKILRLELGSINV